MTEEVSLDQPKIKTNSRPAALSIILLLSFIGSGTGILMALVIAFGGPLAGFFNNLPITDAILRDDSMGNIYYAILKIFLYGSSLLGLILMWRLRRKGFWIYLTAQLLLLVLPLVFLSGMGTNYLMLRLLINIIFTLFFLMLYLLYFKRMK